MCTIFSAVQLKGGVGKTTLTLNLSAALARMGVKVLAVDNDGQANLTMALGYPQPDELPLTLPTVLQTVIDNQMKPGVPPLIANREYILHAHGFDFVPSSIELSAMESVLINTLSRENVMKRFLSHVKDDYDVVLIDCAPALNVVTINALTAANKVFVPLQPQFFSEKGLELLLQAIGSVQMQLNPSLEIAGALITMYDGRAKYSREFITKIEERFGGDFKLFDTKIPMSVRATETQAEGKSIFEYDPKGKIAAGYMRFAEELIDSGVIEIGGGVNG